eukprot:scaffold15051_cov144-Amphora_coffeaeformis.AAC.5
MTLLFSLVVVLHRRKDELFAASLEGNKKYCSCGDESVSTEIQSSKRARLCPRRTDSRIHSRKEGREGKEGSSAAAGTICCYMRATRQRRILYDNCRMKENGTHLDYSLCRAD